MAHLSIRRGKEHQPGLPVSLLSLQLSLTSVDSAVVPTKNACVCKGTSGLISRDRTHFCQTAQVTPYQATNIGIELAETVTTATVRFASDQARNPVRDQSSTLRAVRLVASR